MLSMVSGVVIAARLSAKKHDATRTFSWTRGRETHPDTNTTEKTTTTSYKQLQPVTKSVVWAEPWFLATPKHATKTYKHLHTPTHIYSTHTQRHGFPSPSRLAV